MRQTLKTTTNNVETDRIYTIWTQAVLLTKHLSVSILFRDFRLKGDFTKRYPETSYGPVARREVQEGLVGDHPWSFDFLKLRKS